MFFKIFRGYVVRKWLRRQAARAGVDFRRLHTESSILRQVLPVARPMIFDVGAHIGTSTQLYKSLYPGAAVHAFEPTPATFERLQERTAELADVHLNQLGVGAEPGRLTLFQGSSSATNSFLRADAGSEWRAELGIEETGEVAVDVITLDGYAAAHKIEYIDYLKIDVQGFEPECLQGASGLLSAGRIGVIKAEIIFDIFYERPRSFFDLEQILSPHGYRLFTLLDPSYARTGRLLQLDAVYVHADRK